MTKLNLACSAAVLASLVAADGRIDTTAFDKRADWLASNGSKVDAVTHALAVAALMASMPHDQKGHNCSIRAHRLLSSMPKGSRALDLAQWMADHSNIRAKRGKDGKWTVGLLSKELKGYRSTFDIDAANASPFWLKKEQGGDIKAFDLGAIIAMLKGGVRQASEGKMTITEQEAKMADMLLAFANENKMPSEKRKPAPVAAAA